MEIIVKAAGLLLSLSILVVIHELGHFLFARLFKVRVDKFYMFFNPNFSLVRAKKIKGKWQFRFFARNIPDAFRPKLDSDGDPLHDNKGKGIFENIPLEEFDDADWRKYPETTEFGLGWVPLGGYCKIGGMLDESMDEGAKTVRYEKWALESRPVWQRMFVMAGGVIFNFILAIIVFAMVLFNWGEQTIPAQNAYMGFNYCQIALDNGFENGDRILTINGDTITDISEITSKIIIEGKQNVVVLRGNDSITLLLGKDFSEQWLNVRAKMFITAIRMPFVVDSVMPNSPAEAIHLQKSDSIVAVNGKYLADLSLIRQELALCGGKKIDITYFRQNKIFTDSINISDAGTIGVGLVNANKYFKTKTLEYGFFSAFPAGLKLGVETLMSYIKQFRLVFTKAGAKNVGGFISMGSIFPSTWDWYKFWNMTALLSVILAFMNILPIPVLDGGYLLFLLYELITRRKPSDRFMEISLKIGMGLVLALLVLANGNDIVNWLSKFF
ncbi:MAG: RIP metalloprotease RseP [Paludibacter sp.]|jgi:regulator of sigma E protease|nr:RIP metalloprotease RseP [Paludibacter sp.]